MFNLCVPRGPGRSLTGREPCDQQPIYAAQKRTASSIQFPDTTCSN